MGKFPQPLWFRTPKAFLRYFQGSGGIDFMCIDYDFPLDGRSRKGKPVTIPCFVIPFDLSVENVPVVVEKTGTPEEVQQNKRRQERLKEVRQSIKDWQTAVGKINGQTFEFQKEKPNGEYATFMGTILAHIEDQKIIVNVVV